MFFTGDSDTRVDPLHARKMTALLAGGLLQRPAHPAALQPRRGHSAGVGVEQQIQDDADSSRFCGRKPDSLWASKRLPTPGTHCAPA